MKDELKKALEVLKDDLGYVSKLSVVTDDIVTDEIYEIEQLIKKMEAKV